MRGYLFALGRAGAIVAEGVLNAVLADAVHCEELVIFAMGMEHAQHQRLKALTEALEQVHTAFGNGTHGLARTNVILYSTQEDTDSEPNIATQCTDTSDALLLDALLSENEQNDAALKTAPAAAIQWAMALDDRLQGVLERVSSQAQHEGSQCQIVLCGSLAEPSGAAGILQLAEALRNQGTPEVCMAVVGLLPVYEADCTGLAKGTLLQSQAPAQRLCLIGLPKDCRTSADDAHLVHWLAVYAVGRFLEGAEGAWTYRAPAGKLQWAVFGEEAEQWKQAHEQLVRMSYLLLTEYGDAVRRMISTPNWLRDRMTGWYAAWFHSLRGAGEERRQREKQVMEAACLLISNYIGWVRGVQLSQPVTMRQASALDRDLQAAAEHYVHLLNVAGQLSMVRDELERSGMANEKIIHRGGSMADSDSEAAVKQMEQLKESLAQMQEEQTALNRQIGGRMTREMLSSALRACTDEANDVRAQSEEAGRRIIRAAKIASDEEMPRVDAARARLARLQRHLAALDGRTARAAQDLRDASRNEERVRPSQISDQPSADEPDGFFPASLLQGILRIEKLEGRAQKNLRDQLIQTWPWRKMPVAQLLNEAALPDPDTAQTPDILSSAAFLEHLFVICKEHVVA